MFGMGWPEMFVIAVVAMLVFGPDKLPELAKQAGGFVRTLKQMADNAKDDIGREIGHDLSGLNLRDLDPREIVRRNILDDAPQPKKSPDRHLKPGEAAPFDPDAT